MLALQLPDGSAYTRRLLKFRFDLIVKIFQQLALLCHLGLRLGVDRCSKLLL